MYIFFFIVVVAVEIQNESVILQSLMGSELNRVFISFIYHYHYFFFFLKQGCLRNELVWAWGGGGGGGRGAWGGGGGGRELEAGGGRNSFDLISVLSGTLES